MNVSLWIILTEGQNDRLRPLQGHEGQENGMSMFKPTHLLSVHTPQTLDGMPVFPTMHGKRILI